LTQIDIGQKIICLQEENGFWWLYSRSCYQFKVFTRFWIIK